MTDLPVSTKETLVKIKKICFLMELVSVGVYLYEYFKIL